MYNLKNQMGRENYTEIIKQIQTCCLKTLNSNINSKFYLQKKSAFV